MSDEEGKRLADPSYRDSRYANVGPDEQVHEWFKSFKDLESFLDSYLFQARGPETAPKILHLGSGDSVISYISNRNEKQADLMVDHASTSSGTRL